MYGKVFRTIYSGSLYGKTEAICMMQAMIVLADEDGIVDMTFNAIVGTTGFDREFAMKGMLELMAPDPMSRNPSDEGRRIRPITPPDATSPESVNGFYVVNYREYRSRAKKADQRAANTERQRKSREQQEAVAPVSRAVAPCHTTERDKARHGPPYTDTEANTNTDSNNPPSSSTAAQSQKRPPRGSSAKVFKPPTVQDVQDYADAAGITLDAASFVDHFTSNGWKVSGRTPMKDWQAAARNWSRRERNFQKHPPDSEAAKAEALRVERTERHRRLVAERRARREGHESEDQVRNQVDNQLREIAEREVG